MSVTVMLELRFKPESVAEAREVFTRELAKTRSFAAPRSSTSSSTKPTRRTGSSTRSGETVADDEAYRAFRAGDGKITDLPPLLAAPPVKTRYVTTDV